MAESIVYLHGVPNSGEMWRPFLERTGGIAPDLPGFGASAKPADADYSFRGLGRHVSELTAGMDRFSLVMHDWGAVGLLAAMERPEAVERLVLIDLVPLLPGYRWHRIARVWRTPVVGELAMGLSTKGIARRLARRESQGLPREVVDAEFERDWKHFDHGTQRAILRLHRSAPEEALAEAGRHLDRIRARTLVVWGADDPYLPTEFARAYADALQGELEIAEGAGHWPWLQRPELIERIATFLAA